MARRPKEDGDSGTIVETRHEKKLAKPRMYKVLLHNDHYTTREFVVAILIEIFRKSETDAVQIMMHVHQRGIGVAGVYTFGWRRPRSTRSRSSRERTSSRCS